MEMQHREPRRTRRRHSRIAAVAIGAMFVASCTSGPAEVNHPASLLPTTVAGAPDTTIVAVAPTTVPADPEVAVEITILPGENASEIIDASPSGSTFEFAPGVHRRFSVSPRDGTTFTGLDGAVLSGAVVLTDPIASDDGWRFDGIEFTGVEHGKCIDGYEGCRFSQDVFIDDVMLWQVTDRADVEPGTWYWEGDTIFIGDDPTNRHVELSVDAHAFVGGADDVTIQNLVIEKYANGAQSGAVQSQLPGNGDRGVGWLIEDVEVRGAHGAGIRTGDETIVRRVYSHHNGQMGISVSGGTNVLIEDSEFAFNNVAGFRWPWEAGGGKFTRTHGLIVRGTYSHDNIGPGLWTDIDAVDTLYESNRVVDNTGPGIFHEISYSAVIRDNLVEGNGFSFSVWLWGAGILIAASSDVEVVGNEVRGNANAIAGIQQDRGSGAIGPYLLSDLNVHHNTIDMGTGRMGLVEDAGDAALFTERGNGFDYNTYEGEVGRVYLWDGRTLDRMGWIDVGQDVNGTWP